MKFRKVSPTKAYIVDYTEAEFADLEKHCKYTNSSVGFQLSKHMKNTRYRNWCAANNSSKWEDTKNELIAKKDHSLLQRDKEGWHLYPGYLGYLPKKIKVEVEDNSTYPEFKLLAWKHKFPHELYNCQQETIDLMLKNPHCHAELATGIGKTITIITLAQQTGNTIIVTPSKDLFKDLVKKFTYYLGANNVGTYGDGKKKIGKPVTICIAKSLTMIKPNTLEWEFFSNASVVIGDECHTLAAATLEKTFHNVLSNVPYRWFLSGTAVRGDGTGKMLKSVIGPQVYSFNTKQGIEAGILCNLEFKIVKILTDKPGKTSKDPMVEKRNHLLRNTNASNFYSKMANLLYEKKNQKTLILVEEIEQICMLAKKLRVPFTYAHGNTVKKADLEKLNKKHGTNIESRTKNDERIDAFNKGEFGVFIGTSCVSTGTNFFANAHTMNWQGGGSETSTKQGSIGRSVRQLHLSEYAHLHDPITLRTVWDLDIVGVEKMQKQLMQRIEYYEETGETLKFIEGIK